MSGAILEVSGARVRREGRVVLEGCDLAIQPGETVSLYGPNGAGKTTLLLAAAGLLPLEAGSVRFNGQLLGSELRLLSYHRRTAAVFQEPLLLKGTVAYNVELGLRLRGVPHSAAKPRAALWMERLRIASLAERSVRTLSAGEAQRTSLARAFVLEPEVLFLDEPFAALDAPTRRRLVAELGEILAERRLATLFVTHDLDEAFELSSRGLVMDEGRVLLEGALEDAVRRPKTRRIAEITGAENLFEGVVISADASGTSLDWQGLRLSGSPSALAPGTPVTFLVHADRIRLGERSEHTSESHFACRLERVRPHLGRATVRVRLDNQQTLTVLLPAERASQVAEESHVVIPRDAVWIIL